MTRAARSLGLGVAGAAAIGGLLMYSGLGGPGGTGGGGGESYHVDLHATPRATGTDLREMRWRFARYWPPGIGWRL
jgi:hypothetical protein